MPRLDEGPPRKGFFELAEYESMLAALADEIKPVLIFGFATGCRRGEILALQWSQVDFLGRVIRLEPGTTKNKEGRTIPLSEHLVETLKRQSEIRERYHPKSPWVFFRHATGEPLKDFRGAWGAACLKCGLWDKAKEKPTRLFHDLRRTAFRDLTPAGVPQRVAMSISGHKTRSVFDRYNIVDKEDLTQGIQRRDD
ncbi:MAG: site-specific integrase [Acidobacteriota bacterium]